MSMRIPTTSQVGCVVLFAAISGFLGARYWVNSRTLRAVDMPVSLARGTISTGTFNLNTHGYYSIGIGEEHGGNRSCNVRLETRRISSIGGLPVYRYQWLEDESRSTGRNTITGYFLGGFEGKPGDYHLEVEVMSDTGCLDGGKPHLYIIASSNDFAILNNCYENVLWISFVSSSLGLTLLIIGIRERFRRRATDGRSIVRFEPSGSIGNYPALQRVKNAPWIPFFSQIGVLYSQVLLLLVISGILVFHYAWGYDHRSHGLFVLTYFPESFFFKHNPCEQAWIVRMESSNEWYLNSARIEPGDLPDALRGQIGTRTSCIVFLDAQPDVPYSEAIHAIDLIEQTPGKVVLLTPESKGTRIP